MFPFCSQNFQCNASKGIWEPQLGWAPYKEPALWSAGHSTSSASPQPPNHPQWPLSHPCRHPGSRHEPGTNSEPWARHGHLACGLDYQAWAAGSGIPAPTGSAVPPGGYFAHSIYSSGAPRDGQLALTALCDPLSSCTWTNRNMWCCSARGILPPALQQPRVLCRQFMRAQNQQISHSKLLISLAVFLFFPVKNFPETLH